MVKGQKFFYNLLVCFLQLLQYEFTMLALPLLRLFPWLPQMQGHGWKYRKSIFSSLQSVSYVELVGSLTAFFSSFERPVLFLVLFQKYCSDSWSNPGNYCLLFHSSESLFQMKIRPCEYTFYKVNGLKIELGNQKVYLSIHAPY